MVHAAAEVAPFTTMASAILFGTVIFTTVALSIHTVVLSGDSRLWKAAYQQQQSNARSRALDVSSFDSVYTLLYHSSVFGLILFYAYICEYHPPYPHAEKVYDRDEFFFLVALLFVVAAFTLKSHCNSNKNNATDSLNAKRKSLRDKPLMESSSSSSNAYTTVAAPNHNGAVVVENVDEATEILNRDQTEEWKGWMQTMFLLYHYYHAEEVYNAIRIMITCYVWMTGFGNLSFFYLKQDYGVVRVLQMLWRLNFLVLFLCLTQGTTYILYYICLLHTFYFFLVYGTMAVANHVNYTVWGIRVKMAIVAVLIYIIWDVDSGLFRILHRLFLGETPILGATSGAMWEWYFRSTLDHWSTFLGMNFALNFPITSLFVRTIEAQPLHIHIAAKTAIGMGFAAAFYWWVQGPFGLSKLEYNQTNSYFGIVPLLTYIYFRNLTPWLRGHTLELLHQIGKTTLETYLMQHHIWLTSDAKSLLTLLPGWPKMNFLIVTVIYVAVSRRLYQLTLFLRGMILPNDRTACLLNLLGMAVVVACCLFMTFLLRLLGILNLISIAVCCTTCGTILYTVLTRDDKNNKLSLTTRRRRSLSLGGGILVLLGLGSLWNHMAKTGASKIQSLPATCDAYVMQGEWIPLCATEDVRGQRYRDNGIGAFGSSCDESQPSPGVWGWQAAPSNTYCRFAYRDAKTLLKTLNHRNITFIGDSMIRHLYHATCRQLGDVNAGAYNTSMGKWSDYSKTFKNTAMEFRWAPYADDLIAILNNVKAEVDLVVLGGGAWDRLHRYHNVSEQESLQSKVRALASKMQQIRASGVPVAWVIPTTINTWALGTDEKREHLTEQNMASLREMYVLEGIHDAASFVLDGRAFSTSRVAESYDGVHYPLAVYDGGAQILSNALDWLLPTKESTDNFDAPRPGKMANPFLGLVMLVFVAIGLFCFDGFMGMSYLASCLVPAPFKLFYEAFSALHARAKLPTIPFGDMKPLAEILDDRRSLQSSRSASVESSRSGSLVKSKASDYAGDTDLSELDSFLENLNAEDEVRVV